jgi:hypothetical protein
MLDQLVSLLALGLMSLAAYGLGRSLLAILRLDGDDRLAHGVWSIAIGLVIVGMLLAGLGMAGLLWRPLIAGLSVVAGLGGVAMLVRSHTQWLKKVIAAGGHYDDEETPSIAMACPPPAGWILWVALSLAVAASLSALVAALAPPTDAAALARYLELPKTFLANHAISYLPDRHSTAPLLAEMWYLWALALDGPVAAQLAHWGLGLLLGLASVVLATPVIGRSWAWIVGAVVLLVPEVNHQMQLPLVDLGLALMTTLAVAGWRRVALDDQPQGWLIPAGLAAGGALAIRPEAALFGAAMMIPMVWLGRRQPARRGLLAKGAGVVALVAVAVAGLWYARAACHPGPFPCFAGEAWRSAIEQRFAECRHFGVLLLAVAPGMAVARRLRGLGTLLVGALIYTGCWWLLGQRAGLLLPAIPVFAIATVWVMVELYRFPAVARWVAAAAIVALAVVDVAGDAMSCRDRLPVAMLQETRDAYLERREPTWPAADIMNQITSPGTRLLSQEERTFYFRCPVTLEKTYLQTDGDRLRDLKPGDFSGLLRESGFSHVLLTETVAADSRAGASLAWRLAEASTAIAGHEDWLTLCRYTFTEPDGTQRRYWLLMLTDP